MKTIKTYLYLIVLTGLYPVVAHAQTPTSLAQNEPLYNREDMLAYDAQDPAWQYKVEKEVNLPASDSYETVRVADMQEIIHYASLYSDQLDFRASVSQLLDVVEHHPDQSYRILAAVALHAIGDHYGMEGLKKAVRSERDPLVQRITKAALKDYAKRQTQ